ncbi:transcriptional regulator [Pseudomonas huanghezhanensis]|uniref:transcriptional regulator n=1 Tax=Pseudomonas huanghezhanensis TaxID=3002903 RepID=UPI0022864468|nr:transcriptional regulator [Pseudomonas sp. BSw22131]
MSDKYDWDLIERLLHEVQNSADDSFKPRKYAEEHAAANGAEGEGVGNLDALKMQATNYEALLVRNGFIESRPEGEGGNGENFVLTPRGASLLAMIDSSIPGDNHPRKVLDDQHDGLDPATFDEVASKAQIAGGSI